MPINCITKHFLFLTRPGICSKYERSFKIVKLYNILQNFKWIMKLCVYSDPITYMYVHTYYATHNWERYIQFCCAISINQYRFWGVGVDECILWWRFSKQEQLHFLRIDDNDFKRRRTQLEHFSKRGQQEIHLLLSSHLVTVHVRSRQRKLILRTSLT
jgi:hypothetical protein